MVSGKAEGGGWFGIGEGNGFGNFVRGFDREVYEFEFRSCGESRHYFRSYPELIIKK